MKRTTPPSVEAYLAALPAKARSHVSTVRRAIRKAAPGVEERISYQIPAFKLGSQYLVYVAAFKAHIGIYPAPKGDQAFDAAVAPYRSGKASLRFPLDQPLPLGLITTVVKLRKRALLEAARKGAR